MKDISQVISFLLRFTREISLSRLRILMIGLAGAGSGLASVGLVALMNRTLSTVNEVTDPRVLWGFVVLCVVLPVARFISSVLLMKLSLTTVLEVRMQLAKKILGSPLRTLEQLGPHRLLATLTDDVGSLSAALSTVPLLCMHGAVLVGCLVYLGWLSWPLLLVVLLAMGVGLVTYQIPLTRAIGHMRVSREHWDALFKALQGLTGGAKELKLHSQRRAVFFEDHLRASATLQQAASYRGGLITTAAQSWGQILFYVLIGGVILVYPRYFPVSREALTGYVLVILHLMGPLEILLNIIPGLARARVAVQKIENLGLELASAEEEGLALSGTNGNLDWSEITLEGVQHTYYQETEADGFDLGPIDLTFRRGELVFIVGGNGTGKTTFVKLILGLYVPEKGRILLDQEVVSDQTRDSYRQLFTAVFSDFYLFEELLGIDSANVDSRARHFLEELKLDHKVEVDGGKLSTIELSQGQRKRLALMTAFLEDRQIYVFDEWAADQDPYFKRIFYHELLPALRADGKTVLVVSHDDQYYGVADRLIKLADGKIAYDGPVLEQGEYQLIGTGAE